MVTSCVWTSCVCVSNCVCDDKLTRCVSRVVCDVDDVEEEGSGRRRRRECRPKTRTPHKDVGKKIENM